MPPALKQKQFGLPRWVWLAALTGGVVVGLYIRSRRAEAEATEDEEYTAEGELGTEAAFGEAEYTGLDGLPVGFYDAVSGAGDYLPDAVGEDTQQPIINIYTADGKVEAKRTPKPKAPKATKPKPGKPGKPKPGKPKPGKPKPKPGKPQGGGGPPKKPKPKIAAPKGAVKPKKPKPPVKPVYYTSKKNVPKKAKQRLR